MSSNSQAFDTLMEVAVNTRRSAKGLPAQADIKPHWSGIGFELFGRRFVSPMGEVTEMLDMPAHSTLPGVQQWLRGLANVRGRLLPLTDMAAFFGGRLEAPKRSRRVLVIEHREIYSGLIVDGVLGMQHFPVDSYVAAMASVPQGTAMLPYLQGSFHEESGRDWIVFSPWLLLEDENFFRAGLAG